MTDSTTAAATIDPLEMDRNETGRPSGEPSIAPLRPRTALIGFVLIYGLTILSCAIINIWVQHFPIGTWTVDQVPKNFWLDNVSWQIFAAWWACLFAVCAMWPFQSLPPLPRGLVVLLISWILGWVTAKAIFVLGLGASWIFPIVGTSWFLMAFLSFNGENWLVRGFSPGRQFVLLLLLIIAGTYLITHSSVRWIPAWWFPFELVGAGTGLLAYLTRGMTQPSKAVMQMGLLFCVAGLCIWISTYLGLWDQTASPISKFWQMGHLTADNDWLVFFMVGTSLNFALPVITHNWPFTKIAMPWGGLIACAFYLVLDVIVTLALLRMVGTIFASKEELLTYAYMGVNWSLTVPLLFGVGMSEPYLWTGQRTAGTWEDMPA